MTNTFPAYLNEAGQQHVAEKLTDLGLNWDASATCTDIEERISFQELEQGVGDVMEYEISNFNVGISSYGAFASIEIDADKHVHFEIADG